MPAPPPAMDQSPPLRAADPARVGEPISALDHPDGREPDSSRRGSRYSATAATARGLLPNGGPCRKRSRTCRSKLNKRPLRYNRVRREVALRNPAAARYSMGDRANQLKGGDYFFSPCLSFSSLASSFTFLPSSD